MGNKASTKLYNTERKMQFITEARSGTNFGCSVFNTTQPYEEDTKQDVCEFSVEILQSIVDKCFGVRARTVDTVIGFLRAYVEWCREHGYSTSDAIFNVKNDTSEKIRSSMVSSPKHLEMILDAVFEPVDRETVDCIYRCYLWMAFAGLEDVDAVKVKISEIDFDAMLIEHNGRSFNIYREAVPAFRAACNATEFTYIHPKYGEVIRERHVGDNLMRGIRSESVKVETARSSVGKKLRESGYEITYGKIRLSGVFYEAYESERMGVPANFNGLVEEKLARMNHKYNGKYTRSKQAYAIRQDLLTDYKRWKDAFR